jgi:acetate---CoA ligase (ADP-forming)
VQQMVGTGVEVLLTARLDSDLGPILAIGSGGSQVELAADLAYLSAEATGDEIRAALGGLRLHRLLAGYRGSPAADAEALVRLAMTVGDRFRALARPVTEVEVNPLFVLPGTGGVCAVDLRVVWGAEP